MKKLFKHARKALSVQPSDHTPIQRQSLPFAIVTICGAASLLLGLVLIIFAHYHERAYIFLALGAGGFIGGIAGILGTGRRTALSCGVIALGMMSLVVGLNYLADRYGPSPNQTNAAIVITFGLAAILTSIIGRLMARPRSVLATLSNLLMLGVIASLGIVVVIVGTVYLVVRQSQEHALLLLAVGVLCLITGIASGALARGRRVA
jgi:hypothetical protein